MSLSETSGARSRHEDPLEPIRVAVFYEDRVTGLLAAQLLDRITTRLDPHYTFRRSLWRLDLLALPEARHLAVEEARRADVVLVAVHEPGAALAVMQEWLEAGACDGFNVMFPTIPGGVEDFVNLVVPELQRRGLFRREYTGTTLREHLGLPRPDNQFFRGTTR